MRVDLDDVLGFAFVFIVLSFVGLATQVDRMKAPAYIAAIEQLRADVQQIDIEVGDHVWGQVVETNQLIRRKQTYNEFWWYDWVISERWNDVALIEIQ